MYWPGLKTRVIFRFRATYGLSAGVGVPMKREGVFR